MVSAKAGNTQRQQSGPRKSRMEMVQCHLERSGRMYGGQYATREKETAVGVKDGTKDKNVRTDGRATRTDVAARRARAQQQWQVFGF